MLRSSLSIARAALVLGAGLALAPNQPALFDPLPIVRTQTRRQARGGLRAVFDVGGYVKRPHQTFKQARRNVLKARAVRAAKRGAR